MSQSALAVKLWGELNIVFLVGLYLTADPSFKELVVNAMVAGGGARMAKLDGKTCTTLDLVRRTSCEWQEGPDADADQVPESALGLN